MRTYKGAWYIRTPEGPKHIKLPVSDRFNIYWVAGLRSDWAIRLRKLQYQG